MILKSSYDNNLYDRFGYKNSRHEREIHGKKNNKTIKDSVQQEKATHSALIEKEDFF